MAKEICISSTPHETRLAILEDDQLAEIYYERENEYTLAGSIYNGRVTRVLPGMQSAFVDLGLERDAFLYVTDFIELEDQAEAEELEHAAASGATQPPREVRHGNGRRDARGQRGAQPEPRAERRPAEPESFAHEAPEAAEAENTASEAPAQAGDDADAQANRRWRGRRHRRGRGRGTGAPERQGEPAQEARETESRFEEAPLTSEVAPEIHASAHFAGVPAEHVQPEGAHRGRRSHTAEAFVLPGESLSKYGGTPAAETAKASAESVQPTRKGTSRPSTLIESPLAWDGSGLLPGESLSGRRGRQAEPAEEQPVEEPSAEIEEGTEPEVPAELQFEEVEIDDERSPAAAAQPAQAEEQAETESEEFASTHPFAEREDDVPAHDTPEFEPEAENERGSAGEGTTHSARDAAQAIDETAANGGTDDESDASASHRINPIPPRGFRLFGLGSGGKKKPDGPAAETHVPEQPAPAAVAPPPSYSPGAGMVEEEVIEGEEYDAAPHHHRHKSEGGDFDDYEEETLASQIRSGGLGEMLQEAHLDHRIDVTFDEKNGVEEEEGEEEEEEEAASGAQPAPGHQRRERGGRTRRGRTTPPGRGGDRRGPRRSVQATEMPIISDLLKPGQEILVQIAKEPIAKKGARITSHIALPGRFLVFMPTVTHVGVSRKIASDEERHRLKRVLLHERGESSGGFIVRTAAEGASEDELRADLRFLIHLWDEIKQRSEGSKSPALIYHDLSLIERILRDQVSADFSNIWVDSEADYERIVRFLNRFSPSLVRRVKLYTKETPLFEHFGIQDEISKALRSKVWLKSGGSIVINQTEALVAIDINTGKYVGKSARLEDTILKTNLDAVPEIVRQIRLRDLGGIIVIDFIDMDERKNRFKVMAALEEALKSDRAPTKVLQFNDFGLVAITRKRVKQSLERTLSVPCPTCQATGMVKSAATVCNEIWVEMRKMRRHFENADVMLRVHPETVKVLKSGNGRWLTELEELVGKNILVKSDPALHPEQFDIQG
ncbi:MAG TPA: Rne/Rng family ribonuclease [Terracidiphilus sp.]|nr:Rne/Rng family ribonuclease [Terracidiphilus sp.]